MAVEFGAAFFGAVVPSIGKLLKYEWGLTNTVKNGVASLQAELREMLTFLQDVSSLRPEQLNPHVKNQALEVRDLRHDIDTKLHSFMVRLEASKDAPIPLMSKVRINHEMEMYIKDTGIKIEDMRQRHRGRYPSKAKMQISQEEKSSGQIAKEIRYMDDRDNRESSPVGLDGAIDEVTKKLSMADLVSIAGMWGMGKTTLAVAVYDKMKGDFDCNAFVHIGQRPDMQKILKDIYKQIQTPDEDQMKKFLEDKRCLFVLDDIWHEETWNLVEPVFKGSAGSKIITTSRNHKIAEEIGGVAYQIKPLSLGDSRKLLHAKAQPNSHDDQVVSDEFLRKCDGVPLAITVIGSMLAKNPSKGWRKVYDSIKFDDKGGVFEYVKTVLSSSYLHLPLEIKECVLYLSLFPKGHLIEKNMLIWMWVADGLVNDGSFELGESYFNELLDRSIVQRAMSPGDVGQGGCRVHSLMLDLIRHLSSSENFSTVLDMEQETTSKTKTIHRLAIHQKIYQITSLEVGQVRSFFASTCPGSSLPPLSKFAHVRAIDLEACDLSDGDCELKHLGKLEELKYVGLVDTHVAKLPVEKGEFKFLETLDVKATGISELPSFIENLKKLRCLRAGKGTRMMGKVGELTSLEELYLYSVDKSPNFAVGLRKLTKLRVLVIHFDEMDESMQKKLVESLGYLNKLQVLQIWFDTKGKVRLGGWDGSVPNPELRQLLLFGVILSEQTPWIHHLSVPKLSKLLLLVEILEKHHLEILGQVSSLRSLYLHSEDKYRLSYTANKNEFQVLEYLNTNIELICGDGALPRIQELEVGGIRVGMDVGLQGNMPLLERATYHLDCLDCGPVEVHKAEEELRHASQAHPNRPAITIRRWNNVGLEMQNLLAESQIPEITRGSISSFLVGSPGLGGGGGEGEADVTSFRSMLLGNPAFLSAFVETATRALPTIGAPPTLTVVDPTDTPSQSPSSTNQFTTEVPQARAEDCEAMEPISPHCEAMCEDGGVVSLLNSPHCEAMEPVSLTMRLLHQITNNFSKEQLLGQGAYGEVYRGVRDNGQEIAVKLLYENMQTIDGKQFIHEFGNLMMLKHPNIVRLVGYCYETQRQHMDFKGKFVFGEKTHKALCFEYMPKGSLQKHLYDESIGLDWQTRYKIIKGACEGLKYLHTGLEKPFYHLDLKPDNILLDEDMAPKLADFGLSKFYGEEPTKVTKSCTGTIGYMPPEYLFENVVSNKVDIFSLGVVMTKVIAGPSGRTRHAQMNYQEFLGQVQGNWRKRLQSTWSSSELLEVQCHQVKRCIEIAVSCTETDRHKRPSIVDIINELKKTEILIEKVT